MQLTINKPLKRLPKTKSCFRLHVVGMSGDADHYETNTSDCPDWADMLPEFNLMVRGFQAARLYSNSALKAALTLEGEKLPNGSYAQDVYAEMVGYDVTSQSGDLCMPEKMYVTWFNEFGIEHSVTLIDDEGTETDEINEYNADKF